VPTATRDLPVFLAAVLRNPGSVGAIAPSSRALARVLATVVPRQGAPTVVELGPGTGVVTGAITARLPEAGRQFAVELDAALAAHLAAGHPRARVLCGDAVDLDRMLAAEGIREVDAVVSGLPWSLFPTERQDRLLAAVTRALTPAGAFSTFAYRHAAPLAGARRFRALLDRHFDRVVLTRTVWRNVPPALVYVCHGPLT
jgi:phospholipid N-methyltransferase